MQTKSVNTRWQNDKLYNYFSLSLIDFVLFFRTIVVQPSEAKQLPHHPMRRRSICVRNLWYRWDILSSTASPGRRPSASQLAPTHTHLIFISSSAGKEVHGYAKEVHGPGSEFQPKHGNMPRSLSHKFKLLEERWAHRMHIRLVGYTRTHYMRSAKVFGMLASDASMCASVSYRHFLHKSPLELVLRCVCVCKLLRWQHCQFY